MNSMLRRASIGMVLASCLAGQYPAFIPQVPGASPGQDGSLTTTAPLTIFDPVAANIDLDKDNVFHLTSLFIAPGTTLRFLARRLRAPGPVVLLVNGDAVISGTLDLSGADNLDGAFPEAGPGGYPGNFSGSSEGAFSIGFGPGSADIGCFPVHAVRLTGSSSDGRVCPAIQSYGNASLFPVMTGGSGTFFGGGGGSIRITATGSITIASTGRIRVDSKGRRLSGDIPGGSGGSIFLQAPGINFAPGSQLNLGDSASFGRLRMDGNVSGFTPEGNLYRRGNESVAGVVQLNPPPVRLAPLPTSVPQIDVISVQGQRVPPNPERDFLVPDVNIDTGSATPVIVCANNVPFETTVEVLAAPQIRDVALNRRATGRLVRGGCPVAGYSSGATVSMTFAAVTYTVVAAAKW